MGALYPLDQYLSMQSPYVWLIPDLLPVGGLVNLFGAPKSRKTFIALQLAWAVSDPRVKTELGFQVTRHGPVVYVQLDTPRPLWQERLQRMAQLRDFSRIQFADRESLPFPFDILGEGGTCLQQLLRPLNPALVVFDTLRELHAGDENDSGQMKAVISAIVDTLPPGCSGLLVSHTRKQLQDDDLITAARGSNYVAGRMDGLLQASRKHLTWQSRTADRTVLEVSFDPVAYGVSLVESIVSDARRILREQPELSGRQLAQTLASQLHVSFDRARYAVRQLNLPT